MREINWPRTLAMLLLWAIAAFGCALILLTPGRGGCGS